MFLILVAFKDVQEDLCSRLVSLQLDFLHGQESHLNVDFLIGLQAADHWRNREDLLSFLPDSEVVLDGVLATVLQVEVLVLGLADSYRFEVEGLVELHRLIQRDIECLRIQLYVLILLLNAECLNIVDLQNDRLEELLLGDRFEGDVDAFLFKWHEGA